MIRNALRRIPLPAVPALLALLVGLVLSPNRLAAQFVMSGSAGDSSMITITSSAEVEFEPHRAVLFVSLAGADTSGTAALERAIAARARVTEALQRIGYPVQRIQPWGIGLGARPQMGPRVPGAENDQMALFGLRVPVEPMDRLDGVLRALAESGVEAVRLSTFGSADAALAREQAIRQSVEQARRDAEVMAAAAGVRLGALRSLTTFPDYSQMINENQMMSLGNPYERGVTLLPSSTVVRAAVTASWWIVR